MKNVDVYDDRSMRFIEIEPDAAVTSRKTRNTEMSPGLNAAPRGASRPDGASEREAAEFSERGKSAHAAGKVEEARAMFRQAVVLSPRSAEYHWRLGIVERECGQLEIALAEFRESHRLAPHHPLALQLLGISYLDMGRLDDAAIYLTRAAAMDPKDHDTIAALATIYERRGQIEAAWNRLRPLIESGVRSSNIVTAYARIAGRLCREEHALRCIEDALKLPVPLGRAQGMLHYVAADLLAALGRYDEAFAEYSRANAKSPVKFDPAGMIAHVDQTIAYFTKEKLVDLPRATPGDRVPVFIVGMPRSGTTLIEQMLATHPQVHAIGESPMFFHTLATAQEIVRTSAGLPHGLDRLTARAMSEIALRYLQPFAAPGARCVVNKMMSNFMNMGYIQVLLPHAKIIHCVRDPLDVCVSAYTHDFTGDMPWSNSFEHLGVYYRQYQRMMEHWLRVLDLHVMDVIYEDVVNDPVRHFRSIVEFCGLPWDERCTRFYENERYAVTSSYDEVRRPVYTSSVGRWKAYAAHLEPLKRALGISET